MITKQEYEKAKLIVSEYEHQQSVLEEELKILEEKAKNGDIDLRKILSRRLINFLESYWNYIEDTEKHKNNKWLPIEEIAPDEPLWLSVLLKFNNYEKDFSCFKTYRGIGNAGINELMKQIEPYLEKIKLQK